MSADDGLTPGERAYRRFMQQSGQPTIDQQTSKQTIDQQTSKQTIDQQTSKQTIDQQKGSGRFEDLFAVLGCTALATDAQIAAEYKARAKRTHPDKVRDSDGAEFARITRAYQILTDAGRRAQYQRYWHARLDITFDEWLALKEHHRVVHWSVADPTPTLAFKE